MQFWKRYMPEGYESRPGQIEFMEEAREALSKGGIYMASAPCGIGKSLASLISSMPSVESGMRLIVVYRTRNQLRIYLKELGAISKRCIREPLAVSVISKAEMCPKFRRERISYGALVQACRILRKNCREGVDPRCEYYSRILADKKPVKNFIRECSTKLLAPMEISARAKRKGFCPYEASKLIMPEADIFLGTYHYLFDPEIRAEILRLLDTDLSDCAVIVDEAHNLPSFARDLLSGGLSQGTLERAIGETIEFGGTDAEEIRTTLEKVLDGVFAELSRSLKPEELRRITPSLVGEVLRGPSGEPAEILAELIHGYGERVWEERLGRGERPYSYNHRVGEFLSAFIRSGGPGYAHWILRDKTGEPSLELRNLDGRELTDQVLSGVHSAILMSGTLTPAEVYRDLVAFEVGRIKTREFVSPFPAENRLIVVAKDVSSRVEERTEDTFKRWTEYVEQILESNPGNAAVFFPSYDLMGELLPRVKTKREAVVEDRKTTEKQVLARLSSGDENVIFGVMGGKLSEGIDYPGKLLTCVVSVGFPYASWDDHQQALVQYMDSAFPGQGRLYGYLVPAVLRLLQACGRVHRSERDEGCMVILDRRVCLPYIRKRLPDYFQKEMKVVSNPAECGRLIADFWENREAARKSKG